MRFVVVFMLLSILLPTSYCWAESPEKPYKLKVLYLEFPPYYYTTYDGRPDGFLLKKTDTILRNAGIEPRYESLSAKRVLVEMRTPEAICSIGWFKTPKREKFARFTLPIYQNKPLVALYLSKDSMQLSTKTTLRSLVEDRSLSLGLVDGYSLGAEVDALVRGHGANTRLVMGDYPHLIRMLSQEQFSYILVAPEEKDILIRKNYLAADQFQSHELSDVPAGNSRFLMFSKTVPEEIVERVNRSILSLEKNN